MIKHLNNSSPVSDQLFEFVWSFCAVGAWIASLLEQYGFDTLKNKSKGLKIIYRAKRVKVVIRTLLNI